MNIYRMQKGTRRQRGMSLLETLIALVVFSVGSIGVASMMITSMRNNDATLLRTNSTMLALELYEQILANLPAAEAGNYNLAMGAGLPTTALDCAATSATCTPAQIAEWDLALWSARLTQILAAGADAAVSVSTATDPMTIQIQVLYDELLETAGTTTESFTFRARQ
jgi:type IV pilus assembly protein PilV